MEGVTAMQSDEKRLYEETDETIKILVLPHHL